MSEIRPPDEVIENPDKPTKSAIRPPDEVIENPNKPTNNSKSSVSQPSNICSSSRRRYLDLWMGLVIFIAAGIEAVSWIIPQDKNYILFWYPLLITLVLIVFSSFFVMKAFRYNSCIYSKIASLGYASLNLISFIAIILPNAKAVTVLMFAYPVIIACIIISLLILFARYVINNTTPS